MIIQILGWICTILVAVGFTLNSRKKYISAIVVWIVSDTGWIIYDYNIKNWSHAVLALFIVCMNIYGYRNHKKTLQII